MSVYWDFLEQVQAQIQSQITFATVGDSTRYGTPADDAVVIRHLPYGEDVQSKWCDEKCPGIIISPGNSILRSPDEGNTGYDWNRYPALIQIIDSCEDEFDETKMEDWLNWEQQISRYFSHSNMRSQVSGMFHTTISSTDLFDAKRYARHQNMKMQLVVLGEAELTRDSNAVA